MFQFGSSVRYVRDVNLFSSSEFMCLDHCCQSSLHKSPFGSLFRTVPFLLKLLLFKLAIWPQILLQCPETITKCECWCPEMWLYFRSLALIDDKSDYGLLDISLFEGFWMAGAILGPGFSRYFLLTNCPWDRHPENFHISFWKSLILGPFDSQAWVLSSA